MLVETQYLLYLLRAVEEELRRVLVGLWVGHCIRALELPVLGLERLDDLKEDEGPAKLIAVLLRHIHVPVSGVLLQHELRRLVLSARGGGRGGWEALLQLVDSLLAKGRAHQLDRWRVEGNVDDEVRHFLVFC